MVVPHARYKNWASPVRPDSVMGGLGNRGLVYSARKPRLAEADRQRPLAREQPALPGVNREPAGGSALLPYPTPLVGGVDRVVDPVEGVESVFNNGAAT